jgi:selT/selW/selH-like putative selenoprotein
MHQSFLSVKKFLEQKFPDLADGRVTGGNHPTPPIVELLLKVLSCVQFLGMALIIFGDRVWTSFLRFRQVPLWYYDTVKRYPIPLGVLFFFVLPKFLNRYVATGAFEILVDGKLVYSKLESGQMPNPGDIITIFENLGMMASQV